jgi:hypothetical protein
MNPAPNARKTAIAVVIGHSQNTRAKNASLLIQEEVGQQLVLQRTDRGD